MSLDPTQLDAVRRFLRTNMQFFTGVPLLRSKPFEFPDAPEQRGSLQDAAATKPRTGLVRSLFAFGIALTVSGSLFQYLLWRQTTLESKHHLTPAGDV